MERDARDRRAVRAMVDGIERYSDAPILDAITEELRPLLGAEVGCAYRFGLGSGSWQLDFLHSAGDPPGFRATLDRYVMSADGPMLTGYDALRPPKAQRNVVVHGSELFTREQQMEMPFAKGFLVPLRLHRHHQLRVLVCDGARLLAWVGIIGTGEYGDREKRLLGALASPLRVRLRLEERLRDADVMARGFEAALEALDVAAFLIRGEHVVVHANPAARLLLDSRAIDLPARLRAARRGADPAVSVTPLATHGLPAYALVIVGAPKPDLESRVAKCARAWKLTPRQTEVVRHLVVGESNKAIAERLACSIVTIEVHVSAVLRKARARSRTELTAQFWSDR